MSQPFKMATPQHLPNAPIVEAIIDFRVKTPAGLDIEAFKPLPPSLLATYPFGEQLTKFESTTSIDQTGKTQPTQQIIQEKCGYRHISEDRKFIAQFRKDGFTFSRLAPYTDWDAVFVEAKKLFLWYLDIGRIEEINRIAVRYINVLNLPSAGIGNFGKYLASPPRFPAAVPSFLTGFLTRVQILEIETGIEAAVVQAVQQAPAVPEKIPVILDIDVFQASNFPLQPEILFPKIECLRNKKNQIFFDSITEDAKALFL